MVHGGQAGREGNRKTEAGGIWLLQPSQVSPWEDLREPVEPEVARLEVAFRLWEPAQVVPGGGRLRLRSSAVLSQTATSGQRESRDAAVFLAGCEWKARRRAVAAELKLLTWAEREIHREAGCWKSARPV
jgi:hypothetical protein